MTREMADNFPERGYGAERLKEPPPELKSSSQRMNSGRE